MVYKKAISAIVGMTFLVVFLAGFVEAFGVAGSYSLNTPYGTYPGEETTVYLTLQNMMSDEDLIVMASLGEGAGIATIESKQYDVPAGTENVKVPVTIKIPESAPLDTEYIVVVNFETVASGDAGGVSFNTGISFAFKVVLAEPAPASEPEEKPFNVVWVVVILVVIALIVWWWIRSRKKTALVKRKKK